MYLERFRARRPDAFVTGGAQGIGLAIAEALAEAGARVTIADRDGDGSTKRRGRWPTRATRSSVDLLDVTRSATCKSPPTLC